jgi:glycosyltransferase involved in cell wall biosynthesis/ubiquinone/menaquinone biosynthesis C-methylase UbiE
VGTNFLLNRMDSEDYGYKLREQRLVERIKDVDPSWLVEDSIPQSIQFMIDLIPTIRTLLKDWPKWKSLSVLDVGAASGAGSNLLATMFREHFFDVKMKVDALDIEPKFKSYADSHFPNIRYLVGDISKLEDTSVWDLIICSHTLEHIRNYRGFLSELQRRAKHWVLVYVPYEERKLIPVHHNSFSRGTVRSFKPLMIRVLESPGWKAPVEKKEEVRKCILFVMKGFAARERIVRSLKGERKVGAIQEMVDDKEYEKALPVIEELLKKSPEDGRLNYFFAFCLHMLNKDLQKSLENYELALKYGFDEFWVRFQRGNLYMKLGDLGKARLDLEGALSLRPWDDSTSRALREIKPKILENENEDESQLDELNKADADDQLEQAIREKDSQIMKLSESSRGLETELMRFANEVHALQSINLEHQKTIEEKNSQIMQLRESSKAADEQLEQAMREVDTLQNINLGHQKTIESNQKSIEVLQNINLGHQKTIESNQKSIEVLQNINLGHQKTIEEKDNQIMKLRESSKAADEQMEQAMREVDTLQNINLGHQKTKEEKDSQIMKLSRSSDRPDEGLKQTIQEKDNQIMKLSESSRGLETELKRFSNEVHTLQSINLEHQKTIEEKDSQIMQLREFSKAADEQLEQAAEEIDTLQNINLQHRKAIQERDDQIMQLREFRKAADEQLEQAIQEKDNQIMKLSESNKTGDMELKNLRATIAAIQSSTAWRTLTPIKIRYDAILHRVGKNNINKTKPTSPRTKPRSPTLMQVTTGEQVIKNFVPQRLADKRDIICFPVTDWSFRFQRSNHLVSKFAKNGHRIFFLKVNLYPEDIPYSVENITDNIFEVKLSCSKHFNVYNDIMDKEIDESLLVSSEKMQEDLEIRALSYVAFPSWARIALTLKEKYGWPIIYDCMDEFYGFGNVNKARIDEEQNLFRKSDMVLTTSSFLYKKARKITDKTLYMPNACEFGRFKHPPYNDLLEDIKKPIAGYYGAIADWFDNETLEYVAIERPDVDFVFIGDTFGSNIGTLEKLPNVHFLGEKPYQELPLYLYHFDVCLIPFKPTPLVEATHPLKFYEYLASGKPVVSTKLTELIPFGNLCYLSSSKDEFLSNLDRALDENDPQMVDRRIEFASKNTWDHRFEFLYPEVKSLVSSE